MGTEAFKKLRTEDTGFGIYEFYEDFVVGEWKVDHATAEQVETLRNLFDEFYKGESYGYIGNRVNPHSVDVAEVRHVLRRAENLKEVAFVIYSTVGQSIAYIEKTFYDSHELHIYSELEDAMQWMSEEMAKYKSGSKS